MELGTTASDPMSIDTAWSTLMRNHMAKYRDVLVAQPGVGGEVQVLEPTQADVDAAATCCQCCMRPYVTVIVL